jgi:hypothetical protein
MQGGRIWEVSSPGSRQEIATSESAEPDLPLKASTCGGRGLQSPDQDSQAKWIKVASISEGS